MEKFTMKKLTRPVVVTGNSFAYLIHALALILIAGTGQAVAGGKHAIEGYDPVAYFEMNQAVKGSESITHDWLGNKWFFATEEHRDMFIADPMTYMPNYGGYCSYDPVSAGHDHEIDPTVWRIVDNALYLFYDEKDANHAMPADQWKKVKAGLSQ